MHEAAMFFGLEMSYCQVGSQRLDATETAFYGGQKALQDRNARGGNFCPNKLLGYGMYNTYQIISIHLIQRDFGLRFWHLKANSGQLLTTISAADQ